MPVLSFRSVTFGYQPQRPVLRAVTFALYAGRIAAILGPNGAGKTTLLHLALGWLSPWAGEIYLTGVPLRHLSSRQRGRRMALVPQQEYTPFEYTVLEYVLLGRAPHLPPLGMPSALDTAIALNALRQVGIGHLAQRPVPQLSGGEHQLMLLARALAQIASFPKEKESGSKGALLLLDEPTTHLDLRNKARLMDILRHLRNAGVAMLMTSHDPEIVLALADDVLLMEPGGESQFGPLEEVFTAEALSRIYDLPIRLVKVNGHKQVLWT